ncbi:MAG: tetratricopeptide repeat protein [Syntrophales bacterium]
MAKAAKKEMEQPDRLQALMDKVAGYISRNKKQFFLALVILILAVLAGGGWFIYSMNVENHAQKLYSEAFRSYLSIRAEVNRESAGPAIRLYEDLIKKYPGSNAALIACYDLGNIYYRINEIDKSIDLYNRFLKGSSVRNDLRIFAYNGLGYCYSYKKDYPKSIEMFEKSVQSLNGTALAGAIYGNIAEMYEQMGDTKKAVSYYRKALEQKNEPLMEALIRKKLSELG